MLHCKCELRLRFEPNHPSTAHTNICLAQVLGPTWCIESEPEFCWDSGLSFSFCSIDAPQDVDPSQKVCIMQFALLTRLWDLGPATINPGFQCKVNPQPWAWNTESTRSGSTDPGLQCSVDRPIWAKKIRLQVQTNISKSSLSMSWPCTRESWDTDSAFRE